MSESIPYPTEADERARLVHVTFSFIDQLPTSDNMWLFAYKP